MWARVSSPGPDLHARRAIAGAICTHTPARWACGRCRTAAPSRWSGCGVWAARRGWPVGPAPPALEWRGPEGEAGMVSGGRAQPHPDASPGRPRRGARHVASEVLRFARLLCRVSLAPLWVPEAAGGAACDLVRVCGGVCGDPMVAARARPHPCCARAPTTTPQQIPGCIRPGSANGVSTCGPPRRACAMTTAGQCVM